MGNFPAPLATAAPSSPVVSMPGERRPRVWPGVVIVALLWLCITLPTLLAPGSIMAFMIMFWSPMIAAPLTVVWWLFFSRLPWLERLLVLGAVVAMVIGTVVVAHPSYVFGLLMYGLPQLLTAWVGWLVLTPFLSWPTRRLGLLAAVLLVCVYSTLLRFDGINGVMDAEISWRWTPTAEEKFLAQLAAAPAPTSAPAALALAPGDWPAFRGAERDSRLTGVRIDTDWKANPPELRWRKRVGPGWGSFAVVGKNLYTQEQRGPQEVVVCYHTDSGEERWVYQDETRFTEVVAGPGPRATPTFHEGKLYALGANGKLNCLDPATGKLAWSRDIAADSGAKVPQWGFASSPLVVQGVVTVFAGGPDGKSVLGYNAATGDLAWSAGEGVFGYCSTQRSMTGGVEQVLINTDAGLYSFQPTDGKVLWKHSWQLPDGTARVIQPTVVGDNEFLIGTGFDYGTRRVRVTHTTADGWKDEEVWNTRAIRPYYNDMVVHKGYLYGFDNHFFVCVNAADGEGRWKARGYGNGQVLLLADQDLLLVLSEKGEVALLKANEESHQQLGKFQAIEGKTWNHPVIAHGKLFVRNGEEMACYQLK